MNGSRVPLCERVADLLSFPVLLQIDGGKRYFALNFSEEFKIEARQDNSFKDQEYYSDFATGVGLKGYSKQFLPYFAHRLQNALPLKKEMTSQDIKESLHTVIKYMAH